MTLHKTPPTPDTSPFHAGEQAMQRRAGVRDRLEAAGRHAIRDHMPDQHRELFEKLPFLIVGAADASGQPWATLMTGEPGFVKTEPRLMVVGALPLPQDPVGQALHPGAAVGILGIEPTTSRRNRMNGRVNRVEDGGFGIEVVQSFGNCPKYIQSRGHHRLDHERAPTRHEEALLPGAEAVALISGADTFFIASANGQDHADWTRGVDVSHRGGKPGFVHVSTEGGRMVLTVPDFSGNGFFNTFGNLTLDPRAGLLFVDFAQGHLLQITARATIFWEGPELDAFAGAERLLRLEITGAHWLRDALDLRWDEGQLAPHLPRTGDWGQPLKAA